MRRRAEAVMWQEHIDPQAVIDFFRTEPPHTAKGHFALARALLTRGDVAGAAAALRQAWRNDGFSADLEDQARETFAGLITPADDEARMAARLYAEDDDAGLRAAHHLDADALAIAKARAAVINRLATPRRCSSGAGSRAPRSRLHVQPHPVAAARPTRSRKPRSGSTRRRAIRPQLIDVDQWWVERRLVARKLLDLGDARLAYEVANGAAPPA